MNKKKISVVVPLYNEQDNVQTLYQRLVAALDDLDADCEMIFVDDGSRDQTFDKAALLASTDPNLKVIKFRRNFGQTPAMAAGIDHASGDIVVTMDGDLQNDPLDIPLLVDEIEKGADLAVGWRHNRQDKWLSRKLPSVIANKLIGHVTGVPIKDNGCSLKAYRASLIKKLPLYSEMHRFIPAISSIAGANIVQMRVRHHARQAGESKYGLSRIYKVLFDLLTIKTLTTFSSRPAQWFGMLSIPFLLLAIASGLISPYDISAYGTNANILVTDVLVSCSLAAAFLMTCGVLAELVVKTGKSNPNQFLRLTARMTNLSSRLRHEP